MSRKSTYLFLTLAMCCAASVAQPLNQIKGGLETNRTIYSTHWVCTGDTIGKDSTANNGTIYLIDGFWITCEEITQELWQYNMRYNPSKQQGMFLPVTNITRAEADTFCLKITIGQEPQWRLPTFDEWMFAYNGGIFSEGYLYSGSNNFNFVAWTAQNSDNRLHEVGKLIPNELGLYDMDGNATEMVTDGDQTLCAGLCFLSHIIKHISPTVTEINDTPPECIGLRPVKREPLWFDKYTNRIFR